MNNGLILKNVSDGIQKYIPEQLYNFIAGSKVVQTTESHSIDAYVEVEYKNEEIMFILPRMKYGCIKARFVLIENDLDICYRLFNKQVGQNIIEEFRNKWFSLYKFVRENGFWFEHSHDDWWDVQFFIDSPNDDCVWNEENFRKVCTRIHEFNIYLNEVCEKHNIWL